MIPNDEDDQAAFGGAALNATDGGVPSRFRGCELPAAAAKGRPAAGQQHDRHARVDSRETTDGFKSFKKLDRHLSTGLLECTARTWPVPTRTWPVCWNLYSYYFHADGKTATPR